ncbi:MAG TPA: hypothetical protein VJH06_02590 [Candidatus Paceibacterota bacterium]
MLERIERKPKLKPKITKEQMALANTLFVEPDSGVLSQLTDKLLAVENGGIKFAMKGDTIYLAPEERLFNFDIHTLSRKFRVKDKELIFDFKTAGNGGKISKDLKAAIKERVRIFLFFQRVEIE